MKGYICAILLICGGMVYSEKVRDGCLFGSDVFSVGIHTIHTTTPCSLLACKPNGQIITASCPLVACNDEKEVIGIIAARSDKPYPDCCIKPICKGTYYPEVDDKPYHFPEIGFE
ncbi:uncharacterized protein LOC112463484 [Temnothorax curvispinosus]|uniref:Uncharacterized protein LOC112463484 n=1 Tax=Temnothorax curvispinosus TaxID=300111 RepID=A0A6J1QT41_9HYME|nr:uncharacterized protein LOC112463484 [Temnothorax curvispinosus]